MSIDRERELYKHGCSGLPFGDTFREEFPAIEEMLPLAMAIAVRRLVHIVSDKDTPAKDVIPAARLLFALNGKDVDGADRGEVIDGERIAPELVQALSRIKP